MDETPSLDRVSADFAQTVARRLTLWAVRWVVGFGIIALSVHLWPSLSWLWLAGGAVAIISLATTLVLHFVLQRKMAMVRRKMSEMERLAAAVDDQAGGGDDL